MIMAKKKRTCAVCGKDLTHKNFARIAMTNGEIVTVCQGDCYKQTMMERNKDFNHEVISTPN